VADTKSSHKRAEAKQILFPPAKVVLPCFFHITFHPAILPEYLEGRTPKKKPFSFEKSLYVYQKKQEVFSFGAAEWREMVAR